MTTWFNSKQNYKYFLSISSNSIEWSHKYLIPVVHFLRVNIPLCTESDSSYLNDRLYYFTGNDGLLYFTVDSLYFCFTVIFFFFLAHNAAHVGA